MSSKLENLLDEIAPKEVYEYIGARVNDTLSQYHREENTVDTWDELKKCLAEIYPLLYNAAVGLIQVSKPKDWRMYSEAIKYLEPIYGSGETIYRIAKNGTEGGIYEVIRTLADTIIEDISTDIITSRVMRYWENLGTDEKKKAPKEYIEKFPHFLSNYDKKSIIWQEKIFLKVLENHHDIMNNIMRLRIFEQKI